MNISLDRCVWKKISAGSNRKFNLLLFLFFDFGTGQRRDCMIFGICQGSLFQTAKDHVFFLMDMYRSPSILIYLNHMYRSPS